MIPKIKEGIISSVLHEMVGPSKDPNWRVNTLTKIDIENPIMGAYFRQIEEKHGEQCATAALLVYRIVESQIEADQMNQDFGINYEKS